MQEPLLQLRPGWATLSQGPEQCRCLPDCVQSPLAGPYSELHSLQHVGTAGPAAAGVLSWQPQLVCQPYRSQKGMLTTQCLLAGFHQLLWTKQAP